MQPLEQRQCCNQGIPACTIQGGTCLAILGGVLAIGGVALRATTRHTNLSGEAVVEFAMTEAGEAECFQTALGACSANGC